MIDIFFEKLSDVSFVKLFCHIEAYIVIFFYRLNTNRTFFEREKERRDVLYFPRYRECLLYLERSLLYF